MQWPNAEDTIGFRAFRTRRPTWKSSPSAAHTDKNQTISDGEDLKKQTMQCTPLCSISRLLSRVSNWHRIYFYVFLLEKKGRPQVPAEQTALLHVGSFGIGMRIVRYARAAAMSDRASLHLALLTRTGPTPCVDSILSSQEAILVRSSHV